MEREQYKGVEGEGWAEGTEERRGDAVEIDGRNHEKAEEREREVFDRIREMVAEVKDRVTEAVWEKPKEFVQYCRKEGISGMFSDLMEKLSSSDEGVPDEIRTEAAQAAIEGESEAEG